LLQLKALKRIFAWEMKNDKRFYRTKKFGENFKYDNRGIQEI
jgi:hypothetical protein